MARKADVRKAISQELGSEKAKAFDRLYRKLKTKHGSVRFAEDTNEPILTGENYVRFAVIEPNSILDNMIVEVHRLQEEAIDHRRKYPCLYGQNPHRNAYLFE